MLKDLVESTTRGDPQSPLQWTSKSLRKLSTELQLKGHKVSHMIVRNLLLEMGYSYSLQANRKTDEGSTHCDRDMQFEYINQQAKDFQKENQPVISVDTKKKNWWAISKTMGNGQEWKEKGKTDKAAILIIKKIRANTGGSPLQ